MPLWTDQLDLFVRSSADVVVDSFAAAHAASIVRSQVHSNRLSGSIDTAIGRLSRLVSFYVQRNGFTGSMPTNIGQLSLLTSLCAPRCLVVLAAP